jgi:hypothetical protein
MDEVAVQLAHHLGVLQHGFRLEGARLEIAAPLELEEVALGADDRTLAQPLDQPLARHAPSPRPLNRACEEASTRCAYRERRGTGGENLLLSGGRQHLSRGLRACASVW